VRRDATPVGGVHQGGVSISGGTVSGQIVNASTGTFTQRHGTAAGDPAPLRILYATAASHGDLRVDEEVRRVLAAVRAAIHRDRVRIEHAPAATGSDLLDGLSRFRPHVVHFSGHADGSALAFDSGSDQFGPARYVAAEMFALALRAVDTPPALVVLNACESDAQLAGLLESVPLAIGMRGPILDAGALVFAKRFYQSVADRQSVGASYRLARTDMGFAGHQADRPILAHRPGVDPNRVTLV
jgi:hypothetical protein